MSGTELGFLILILLWIIPMVLIIIFQIIKRFIRKSI